MLIVILSFIYIFLICLLAGVIVRELLSRFIPVPEQGLIGITGIITSGLVILTVYAQYFSIFSKVGALCHVIMLALIAAGTIIYRQKVYEVLKAVITRIPSKEGIACLIIVIISAYFTSRGTYHTDTGIYHAQAIRILEEYGCIKGLGNFQQHFAYNSSYLALCALFTLSFVLPFALHTMTGFFMALFTCYAVCGLMKWKEHDSHTADMARLAIVIYGVTVLSGLQSPATDYGTMYMVLYIMTAWIAHAAEKKDSENDISVQGYLSVLAIFTVSMKLSAAGIVVIAVLPFILLIKKKMAKETAAFIIIGFLSFLPYLIRNVIISGWLFYPVEAIDFFDVIWKVPARYMWEDSARIKIWGRCIQDIVGSDYETGLGMGLSAWYPVWWSAKTFFEKLLLLFQVIGAGAVAFNVVIRAIRKTIRPDVALFYITVFINIIMWFFTAPFIRYGLAFLMLLPLCAMTDAVENIFKNKTILGIAAVLIALVCFGNWTLHYAEVDMAVFTSTMGDEYYVTPIPFEDAETDQIEMNGVTVYNSAHEEINSYYYCPNSCYLDMIKRTELIGSTIEEGFKANK